MIRTFESGDEDTSSKAVKEQVDAAVKEAKDNYVEVEKGKMAAASAFGAEAQVLLR